MVFAIGVRGLKIPRNVTGPLRGLWLVAEHYIGFLTVYHLGEILGRHLCIDRLLDLRVENLIRLHTHSGYALYLSNSQHASIFRQRRFRRLCIRAAIEYLTSFQCSNVFRGRTQPRFDVLLHWENRQALGAR